MTDNTQKQQGKNPLKTELDESHAARIKKLRDQEPQLAIFLQRHPDAPAEQREKDKMAIAIEITRLEAILEGVAPFVYKIRGLIPDMLAETKIAASYFIFGKILQSLQAIFVLARGGFHYECMELIRSITESSDLIFLFMSGNDESADLKKWFSGGIVANEKARLAMEKFMNEQAAKAGVILPVGPMMAGIYGGLSKYTHISYGALLDSYDLYKKDFDFGRQAGHHYTQQSSLPYTADVLNATIVALKFFYHSLNDSATFAELDAALRKIAPEMYDPERIEELTKRTLERFS